MEPVEWLSFIQKQHNKLQDVPLASRISNLQHLYSTAFDQLSACNKDLTCSEAYAELFIDFATLSRDVNSSDQVRKYFEVGCTRVSRIAKMYIAAASFELSLGQQKRATAILEAGLNMKAEPVELIQSELNKLTGHQQNNFTPSVTSQQCRQAQLQHHPLHRHQQLDMNPDSLIHQQQLLTPRLLQRQLLPQQQPKRRALAEITQEVIESNKTLQTTEEKSLNSRQVSLTKFTNLPDVESKSITAPKAEYKYSRVPITNLHDECREPSSKPTVDTLINPSCVEKLTSRMALTQAVHVKILESSHLTAASTTPVFTSQPFTGNAAQAVTAAHSQPSLVSLTQSKFTGPQRVPATKPWFAEESDDDSMISENDFITSETENKLVEMEAGSEHVEDEAILEDNLNDSEFYYHTASNNTLQDEFRKLALSTDLLHAAPRVSSPRLLQLLDRLQPTIQDTNQLTRFSNDRVQPVAGIAVSHDDAFGSWRDRASLRDLPVQLQRASSDKQLFSPARDVYKSSNAYTQATANSSTNGISRLYRHSSVPSVSASNLRVTDIEYEIPLSVLANNISQSSIVTSSSQFLTSSNIHSNSQTKLPISVGSEIRADTAAGTFGADIQLRLQLLPSQNFSADKQFVKVTDHIATSSLDQNKSYNSFPKILSSHEPDSSITLQAGARPPLFCNSLLCDTSRTLDSTLTLLNQSVNSSWLTQNGRSLGLSSGSELFIPKQLHVVTLPSSVLPVVSRFVSNVSTPESRLVTTLSLQMPPLSSESTVVSLAENLSRINNTTPIMSSSSTLIASTSSSTLIASTAIASTVPSVSSVMMVTSIPIAMSASPQYLISVSNVDSAKTKLPTTSDVPVTTGLPLSHTHSDDFSHIKGSQRLIVNGKTYILLGMIGTGGSSKVYQGIGPDGQMRAIKCVDFADITDESTINGYRNEIDLLKRLQKHPEIVTLYDYMFDSAANKLYVVMERGDMDLAMFFKAKKTHEDVRRLLVRPFWIEMLYAVRILHKADIVHSDLKPANFILSCGQIKLIDFGIAKTIQSDRTSLTCDQIVGTFNYMSPEAINDITGGQGNASAPVYKISTKSDVWSLGCILYLLIYSRTPFDHIRNQVAKMLAILDSNHVIEYPPTKEPHVIDILQKCLERNPRRRPSIDELLQHPYVTS